MEDMTYRDLNQRELEIMHLLDDRPIAYKPALAKMFRSVKAGIIISQFLYWSRNKTTIERGGWFYKSEAEVYEETGLSAKEQRKAREILADYYILDTKKMGMPARNWYRIDYKKLIWVVGNRLPVPQLLPDQSSPKGSTGHAQKGGQVVPFGEDIHITESTTESTTEEQSSFSPIPGTQKATNYQPDYQPPKKKASKKTPTEKQRAAFAAMRSITYYREKADEAEMTYFAEEDESANRRYQAQAKEFEKRYRNNWKDVIDWWWADEGAWANFHPSNFFNISTYMKFDNKDKKRKGGAKHYA